MKVPVAARQPSAQGLGYLRAAPSQGAAHVADSMARFGAEVSLFADRVQAREEDTERLQTLANFSDFEAKANIALTELKRVAPADGANYVQQAMSLYDTMQGEFMATVPAHLQDQFNARTADVRNRTELDSYSFQFEQQDAFFKTQVGAEYEKAKQALAAAPDQFDDWSARMAEMIMTTDLPAVTKTELARTMHNGLAAITYGKSVEEIRRVAGQTNVVDKIINIESGGNATARNPKSKAQGLGQFIPGTWREFISERHPELLAQGEDIQKLRNDPSLSREAVQWYADKNAGALAAAGLPVNEGTIYLAHFAGPGGAIALLQAGTAKSAEEVLGSAVIKANPFLRGMTAADVVNWAANKMGTADAIASLDSDPRFAGIPLEDRLTMQDDAERTVSAEETAFAQQQKAANEARLNALYTSLLDGTAGQTSIDAARKAGWLNDVDSIEKAQKLLEQATATQKGAQYIQNLLDTNGALNPTTDADAFNKYIGPQGLQAIGQGSQEYMTNVVIPAVEQLHDLPPDVVGQLTGMTRSNDQAKMGFAYENLATLEDVAPGAYAQRVPEWLAANVNAYRAMRGSATPEELFNHLRGGRNATEVQTSNALDKVAAGLVSKWSSVNNKVWDTTWGPNPDIGDYAAVQVQVEREFVEAFKYYFRASRDENTAISFAQKQIRDNYQKTTLGNGAYLIRHAPESYYPKVSPGIFTSGFDFYDQQIRTEFGIASGEEYQLVSDEITQSEFALWQQDKLGRLPSYQVIKFTVDGLPIIMKDRWAGTFEGVDPKEIVSNGAN